MSAVLAFDIETVPDVAAIRRLYGLPEELADEEVAEFAFQKRRAAGGGDFLPLHLQRVVVISCALEEAERFTVWSLAEPKLREAELIQRFYDGIEKFTPQLVSWNGGGFDLPVLHYRGLLHGLRAPRYWDQGEGDYADSREFRFNNYISRYHSRHLDLMDLLALYQPRASVPLDELARLMGLPGKLGMEGSEVWRAWLAGRMDEIRDYCESDVVNTYLVYLRFQHMRGALTPERYAELTRRVRTTLAGLQQPHWQAFLAAWEG